MLLRLRVSTCSRGEQLGRDYHELVFEAVDWEYRTCVIHTLRESHDSLL